MCLPEIQSRRRHALSLRASRGMSASLLYHAFRIMGYRCVHTRHVGGGRSSGSSKTGLSFPVACVRAAGSFGATNNKIKIIQRRTYGFSDRHFMIPMNYALHTTSTLSEDKSRPDSALASQANASVKSFSLSILRFHPEILGTK